MKLYCFLLIIILLCLLYDNNLYEGYDVSEDRTTTYVDPSETRHIDLLDSFGLGSIIPDSWVPEALRDNTVSGCDRFPLDYDCTQNLIHRDMEWKYNNDTLGEWPEHKKTCVDCLKCKDGGAFIDPFYGHACDAIIGCLDDMSNYNKDALPYIYAYKNTDWETVCSEDKLYLITDEKEKSIKTATCGFFKDNTFLDSVAMLSINRTAECHVAIGELYLQQQTYEGIHGLAKGALTSASNLLSAADTALRSIVP